MRSVEALRTSTLGLEIEAVILNRVVLHPGRCRKCRGTTNSLAKARRLLRREFKTATLYLAEDPGAPILGPKQLKKFAQAIRRMQGGSLTDEQVEHMGEALMKLEAKIHELAAHFGLKPADLNLQLGTVENLLEK